VIDEQAFACQQEVQRAPHDPERGVLDGEKLVRILRSGTYSWENVDDENI
jgi:hypothetical protein